MKYLIWGASLALVVVLVFAVAMRMLGHDPGTWNIDPTIAERTGKPNDYLVAPEGTTVATPDGPGPVAELPAAELLFLFDAIARNAPRVTVVDGSVEDGQITYVQRSVVFGFPDYITVKSLELGEGRSGLVIWSRARIGYSDAGVNEARIQDWLAKMGAVE